MISAATFCELYEYNWWARDRQTYHRGQVTALLRQLGAARVATDFLVAVDSGAKM